MSVIDLLFPKTCLGCKKSGGYICGVCVGKIKPPPAICYQCQKPSIDFMTHVKCRKPLGLDAAVSVFQYQGAIRKAIIKLKYSFAKEIAIELANNVVEKIKNKNVILPKNVVLIPVPLYWYRKNWRGFNQVEEIGKLIAEKLNWGFCPNLLIRKIHKRPQTELKGDKRRENIQGVFSFNSNYQKLKTDNRILILFDDVFTTGSTLKEAGKVLKRNGVKEVWGLTLAR